jgi:hypothetical protein
MYYLSFKDVIRSRVSIRWVHKGESAYVGSVFIVLCKLEKKLVKLIKYYCLETNKIEKINDGHGNFSWAGLIRAIVTELPHKKHHRHTSYTFSGRFKSILSSIVFLKLVQIWMNMWDLYMPVHGRSKYMTRVTWDLKLFKPWIRFEICLNHYIFFVINASRRASVCYFKFCLSMFQKI